MFIKGFEDLFKGDISFPNRPVLVSTAIVVMKLHVTDPVPQEHDPLDDRRGGVTVCMADIKASFQTKVPNLVNRFDNFGGLFTGT